MSKKSLAAAAAVALSLVLAGCSAGPGEVPSAAPDDCGELETVTVSTTSQYPVPWIGTYLADYLGFYAEECLDVEIIANVTGGVTASAIIQGFVEFGGSSIQQALAVVAQNPDAELQWAGFESTWPFHLSVLNDSPVESIGDIEGLKLGVRDEGDTVAVTTMLAEGGLEPTDVEIVRVGQGATLAAALQNGTVDVMFGTPSNEATILDEIRRLPGDSVDAWVNTGLMGPASEAETLGKLARAINKGWIWAQANPQSAGELLAENQPAVVPDVAEAVAQIKSNVAEINIGMIESRGEPSSPEAFAEEVKALEPEGANLDPASLINEEALATAWSFDIDKIRAAAEADDPSAALGANLATE